jgi:hypothetical protein
MEALLNLTTGSYRQLNVIGILHLPMALIDWTSLPSDLAVSFWQLFAVVILAVAAYVSVSGVLQWQRLKHIPGPSGVAWSKWWMLRNTLGGNMHLALEGASETYGKCDLVIRTT